MKGEVYIVMDQQKSSNTNNNPASGKNVLKLLTSMTRNRLERLGALLDTINAKRNQTTNYKPADLSKGNDAMQNVLREHTLKTSSHLFGGRFVNYSQLIKKVLPSDLLDESMDAVFEQLATMAEAWSKIEVTSERKHADFAKLTNNERNAMVNDIANQNRALATMGGVTGLIGLPGMFADALWLLLVSLRLVYQLSAVYGKPLTGKQGIKTAYSVIASSDLSQMQPKQAVLASLGVLSMFVNSANNTASKITNDDQKDALKQQIKDKVADTGLKQEQLNEYAKYVDNLVQKFDLNLDDLLDENNMVWLKRVVNVFAVAAGMHYNSLLIEQIIGTTQATFAPDMKIANIDTVI